MAGLPIVENEPTDVRDTTDQKRIEEQLEHSVAALEASNRELELFSDALAHDLRSPLPIVTNFSAHLEEELGDSLDQQLKDDLQRIRAAGWHMMYLLDDLHILADVNRVEVSQEEVDLSSLGQEIIDDLSARVPDRDVRFEVEPGITAVGDKTLLKILLTNLLQNAWKYTGPSDDARIELGVALDEMDIPTYYVRDNGIGFDNVDREVIFRIFKRLHTRVEFAGSGIGLATVERIVRCYGGRVWGEGILGEGAVFHFTLSRPQRRNEGVRVMTSPPEMLLSMNDALILIVEDNPDDAALIQAVFDVSLVHAKTQLVVSGSEARSYLAGESPYEDRHLYPLPSLIVLDLGLPDSTDFEGGLEVLAWLGKREAVSSIPVIVFTASEDPEHARRAYALGARRFMRKVDDYGELTEAVKEELHRWIETQQREA